MRRQSSARLEIRPDPDPTLDGFAMQEPGRVAPDSNSKAGEGEPG